MKIKHLLVIVFALFGLAMLNTPAVLAQTYDGSGGYNDDAPDEDGDGIPNGHDEDYIKYAKDGLGYKHKNVVQHQTMGTATNNGVVLGYQVRAFFGTMYQYFFGGYGPQDGSGDGICDGSGSGDGTGICDGTGPHGFKRGGR